MKTKEELNALKEEVEELKGKLAELSEEELAQVTGGNAAGNNCYTRDPDAEVDRPGFRECRRCGVYSFCRNKNKIEFHFLVRPQ